MDISALDEWDKSQLSCCPKEDELKKMAEAIPLTPDEILATAFALLRDGEHQIAALKNFTKPAQLYLFMINYNWDRVIMAPMWIVQSPLCDKGAALIAAWRTDLLSEHFSAEGLHPSMRASCKEECALLDVINDLWKQGRYSDGFKFDPTNDRGHTWRGSRNPADLPKIDPGMFGPSPGAEYEWPYLES